MISKIRPEIAQVYTLADTVIHTDFIRIMLKKNGKYSMTGRTRAARTQKINTRIKYVISMPR